MSIGAIVSDLLLYSRIEAAALRAGTPLQRVSSILRLPQEATLLLVAWDERDEDWGQRLLRWREDANLGGPRRLVLFGPHTDLEAHAAAKRHGIGPMWGRSRLVAELDLLLRETSLHQSSGSRWRDSGPAS